MRWSSRNTVRILYTTVICRPAGCLFLASSPCSSSSWWGCGTTRSTRAVVVPRTTPRQQPGTTSHFALFASACCCALLAQAASQQADSPAPVLRTTSIVATNSNSQQWWGLLVPDPHFTHFQQCFPAAAPQQAVLPHFPPAQYCSSVPRFPGFTTLPPCQEYCSSAWCCWFFRSGGGVFFKKATGHNFNGRRCCH